MTILEFPQFGDARGRLAFLEGGQHVPFDIGRVSWWSDAAARVPRRHAASGFNQVMFAIRGQADLRVGEGREQLDTRLERPDRGVLVPLGAAWELLRASDDAIVVTVSEAESRDARSDFGEAASLSTVADARLLPLGSGSREVVVHGNSTVPFNVARLYYLFDVPGHMARGSHAHKDLQQLIVAVGGSFDIRLNDGTTDRVVTLDRPDAGLFVPRMLWRDLENFSSDAVCLVLASLSYDEADYIREYDAYVASRSHARDAGGAAAR